MKMRSPIPHKRARIEIIPLIDIMFFLLASFMMVSLSQTHMKGIRVNLPSANVPPPPPNEKKDYISVRVTEGNLVYRKTARNFNPVIAALMSRSAPLKNSASSSSWRCMNLRSSDDRHALGW